MAVKCVCGKEYPRDPRYDVPCPNCRAKIGSPCKRPSGHRCTWHAERRKVAFEKFPCDCVAQWEERQRRYGRDITAADDPQSHHTQTELFR